MAGRRDRRRDELPGGVRDVSAPRSVRRDRWCILSGLGRRALLPGTALSVAIGDRFPHVLSAAGEGAEWAWAELYEEFAPTLLRFITSQGANEPEDCLGECFIQVVRNLPTFSGDEASFRSWIYLLARNRVVDEWRAAGRRPVTPSGDMVAMHERRRPSESADARLARHDAIEDILAQLNPDQRAVLVLRVLDGFSVEETAVILRRSQGAVRVLQHRAITNLRHSLQSMEPA